MRVEIYSDIICRVNDVVIGIDEFIKEEIEIREEITEEKATIT